MGNNSECFEFNVGFLMELRIFGYNSGKFSFFLWHKISDNIDDDDSRCFQLRIDMFSVNPLTVNYGYNPIPIN